MVWGSNTRGDKKFSPLHTSPDQPCSPPRPQLKWISWLYPGNKATGKWCPNFAIVKNAQNNSKGLGMLTLTVEHNYIYF